MRPAEMTHSVSRGVFYLSIEKVAALVTGVLYFALVLRWLGPTKYGIMTLATSFTGLAALATCNFEMYLERFAAEFEARGQIATLRRAFAIAVGLKLVLGFLAAATVLALSPWIAERFRAHELAALLQILSVGIVFDALSTTGRATLYGTQQFRWVSLLAVLFHVAKTALVGGLWYFRQGLPQLALGLVVLTVAQAIAQAAVPVWMMRHARNREDADDRGLLRGMIGYSLPLLGARITFMSGQNLGKIVLGKLFDPALLGYFTFAFQTVERFVELLATLPAALLPTLTRLVARGEWERLRGGFDQSVRLIQVAACAASFVLFAFARELAVLIGSPLFEPAWPLLRVLALVPLVRTAQAPLTMLFQAIRLPGTVLRLALIKFVAEFGSYFLLVPAVGLIGASWANVIGAATAYLAAQWTVRHHLPFGTGERTRTLLTTNALVFVLLMAVLAIERLGGTTSFVLRLALIPIGLGALFAFRLVNRSDLDRLASVPLRGWMRGVRDTLVAALGPFVRAVPSREAA